MDNGEKILNTDMRSLTSKYFISDLALNNETGFKIKLSILTKETEYHKGIFHNWKMCKSQTHESYDELEKWFYQQSFPDGIEMHSTFRLVESIVDSVSPIKKFEFEYYDITITVSQSAAKALVMRDFAEAFSFYSRVLKNQPKALSIIVDKVKVQLQNGPFNQGNRHVPNRGDCSIAETGYYATKYSGNLGCYTSFFPFSEINMKPLDNIQQCLGLAFAIDEEIKKWLYKLFPEKKYVSTYYLGLNDKDQVNYSISLDKGINVNSLNDW